MLKHQTLRKADVLSGALILILGLFVIQQALQMPMKDSWGGVQNVWFVSPALFPLFIGAILSLLGFILICIAVKSVGLKGIRSTCQLMYSKEFGSFLGSSANIRFYAVVLTLFGFVFLMIPRIDFFLAAIFFLMVLFFMFYLNEHRQIIAIFTFSIFAQSILALLLLTSIKNTLADYSAFFGDWYMMVTIALLIIFARTMSPRQPESRRKFRICLIIAFTAPTVIGIIFKYFLLVPMPFEGVVVQLLDTIWYADIWA